MLADICLKYLMQPCFSALLQRDNDTFRDKMKVDIETHHLLPYAAKYWDRHLDEVENWQQFSVHVKKFVLSKQYFTCIQVQSLLVGGKKKFDHRARIH